MPWHWCHRFYVLKYHVFSRAWIFWLYMLCLISLLHFLSTVDMAQCLPGRWFNIKMACTSIGNPIVEIRRSDDRLISTMGLPILVRCHLYIESGPWCLPVILPKFLWCQLPDPETHAWYMVKYYVCSKFSHSNWIWNVQPTALSNVTFAWPESVDQSTRS